jgi:hypothetical protein
MNRENIRAHECAGRATTVPSKGRAGHLGKELCVIWIPERKSYLQGITRHSLYMVADVARALVLDGDRATEIAERVIEHHGARPVLRNHYTGAQ